jgi:hypothetical protein
MTSRKDWIYFIREIMVTLEIKKSDLLRAIDDCNNLGVSMLALDIPVLRKNTIGFDIVRIKLRE